MAKAFEAAVVLFFWLAFALMLAAGAVRPALPREQPCGCADACGCVEPCKCRTTARPCCGACTCVAE